MSNISSLIGCITISYGGERRNFRPTPPLKRHYSLSFNLSKIQINFSSSASLSKGKVIFPLPEGEQENCTLVLNACERCFLSMS